MVDLAIRGEEKTPEPFASLTSCCKAPQSSSSAPSRPLRTHLFEPAFRCSVRQPAFRAKRSSLISQRFGQLTVLASWIVGPRRRRCQLHRPLPNSRRTRCGNSLIGARFPPFSSRPPAPCRRLSTQQRARSIHVLAVADPCPSLTLGWIRISSPCAG